MEIGSRTYGAGTVAMAAIGIAFIIFIKGIAVTTVGVVLIIASVISLLLAVGKSFDELDRAEGV